MGSRIGVLGEDRSRGAPNVPSDSRLAGVGPMLRDHHDHTQRHWDMHGMAEGTYLVAGLGLPNENEGIGGDDGQAEVDEDDRPF